MHPARWVLFVAICCVSCSRPTPPVPEQIPAIPLEIAETPPKEPAYDTPVEAASASAEPDEASIGIDDRRIVVRDCLLRSDTAELLRTTALPDEVERLDALLDNDAATVAHLTATADVPLELVYGFDDQTVTPLELVVLLPERVFFQGAPASVEILVSSVSPATGYQFLRADPLEATSRIQRFRLRPQGAKWILIRLTPATRAQRLAVSEIALLGRSGPPRSAYAFKESPVNVLDMLARLQDVADLHVTLTEDETRIVDQVREGRLSADLFAEAALLAGGVQDADQRQAFLDQINRWVEEVRSELANTKDDAERGERLLRWMHAHVMTGGYQSLQTDLNEIAERRTFNCVSSAVLYVILAQKLGLDARGIDVPDHAFAILYDETWHADVETTVEVGFNPIRDEQAIQAVEKLTGFVYIPDTDREQRREIREAGLAALIHYNHGVLFAAEGRYPDALAAYFRALTLDHECYPAVHNALITLAQWCLALCEQAKFEDAIAIASLGRSLAPQDAGLAFAEFTSWVQFAEAEMIRGGQEAGLAVLRRAAEHDPSGPWNQLQAWLFIRQGEDLLARHEWQAALTLADEAIPLVDAEAQSELRDWQVSAYMRWSRFELASGRFPEALQIIEQAIALYPDRKDLPNWLGLTLQNWARQAESDEERDFVQKSVDRLKNDFPQEATIQKAAKEMTASLVIELTNRGEYEEAVAMVQAQGPWTPSETDAEDLLLSVYDSWAWSFIQDEQWSEAFQVYAKALKKHPDSDHLKANLAWVVQQWLQATQMTGGTPAMIARLRQLKSDYPDLADVVGASPQFVWRTIRDLERQGNYEEARDLLDRQSEFLNDPDDVQEMMVALHDDWAMHHVENSERALALNVYEQALRRYPKDRHIENNLSVVLQRWALALQNAGREAEAKEELLKALARFPDVKMIRSIAEDHVPLLVQRYRQDNEYEAALAALARHRDLLIELHGRDASREEAKIAADVYHAWAQPLVSEKKWDEARAIYRAGLKRYPDESEIESGLASVWDRQAREYFEPKEWKRAMAVYDQGLEELPKHGRLTNNRKYCEQMQQRQQEEAVREAFQKLHPEVTTVHNDPGSPRRWADPEQKIYHVLVTGTTQGSVWGTDEYTTDSTIAAAAVHAGIVPVGETRVVKLEIIPGRESYAGSDRHGVVSRSWKSFENSFRLEKVAGLD